MLWQSLLHRLFYKCIQQNIKTYGHTCISTNGNLFLFSQISSRNHTRKTCTYNLLYAHDFAQYDSQIEKEEHRHNFGYGFSPPPHDRSCNIVSLLEHAPWPPPRLIMGHHHHHIHAFCRLPQADITQTFISWIHHIKIGT